MVLLLMGQENIAAGQSSGHSSVDDNHLQWLSKVNSFSCLSKSNSTSHPVMPYQFSLVLANSVKYQSRIIQYVWFTAYREKRKKHMHTASYSKQNRLCTMNLWHITLLDMALPFSLTVFESVFWVYKKLLAYVTVVWLA